MRAAKLVGLSLCIAGLLPLSCGPFGFEGHKPNPGYCPTSCDDMDAAAPVDMAGQDGGDGSQCPCPDLMTPPDLAPSCVSSSTCPASAPVCSMGKCSSCAVDADGGSSAECSMYHVSTMPETPLCGPAGACVECLTTLDCDKRHLTCNTSMNTCVMCKVNSDCTSGLCASNGMCADESTLLYVDNSNASCSDGGPGSFAQPFCHVQTGLNASAASSAASPPGKTVIVFAGNGYTEAIIASPAQNGGGSYVASAVGVGGAQVKASGAAMLTVSGQSGKQVNVSLDGFVFNGASASDGALCIGGGANYADTVVTVLRSTVENGPAVGISASAKCSLTLDADTITNNKGGGVKADTSNFVFTNLLVNGNGKADTSLGSGDGSAFGGFNISAGGQDRAHMVMFNNTVVNNVASATVASASGISCSAVPTLANTVMFGNTGPTAQVAAGCQPNYSAYVGAGAVNASHNQELATCQASDLFLSGGFQPKQGGTLPCSLIGDGVASFMSIAAPDHDISNNPRPSGGGFDVGSYQH